MVKTTLITIGDNNERAPNTANIYVKLSNPEEREQNQEAVMAQIRREIVAQQPKDLRIDVSEVPMFAGGGCATCRSCTRSAGRTWTSSRSTAEADRGVKKIPGAVDVDSNSAGGRPELSISIDRERAADLGVSQSDLSATLRLLVGGDRSRPTRKTARRTTFICAPRRTSASTPPVWRWSTCRRKNSGQCRCSTW